MMSQKTNFLFKWHYLQISYNLSSTDVVFSCRNICVFYKYNPFCICESLGIFGV